VRRSVGYSLLLLFSVACSSGQSAEGPAPAARLAPLAVRASDGTDVSALFDRDTPPRCTSTRRRRRADVRPRGGTRRDQARGRQRDLGVGRRRRSAGLHLRGWLAARPARRAREARAWTVHLAPRGPGATVSELELWAWACGRLRAIPARWRTRPLEAPTCRTTTPRRAHLEQRRGARPGRRPPLASFDFLAALPPARCTAPSWPTRRRACSGHRSAAQPQRRRAGGRLWLGGGDRERSVVDELDPAKLSGSTRSSCACPTWRRKPCSSPRHASCSSWTTGRTCSIATRRSAPARRSTANPAPRVVGRPAFALLRSAMSSTSPPSNWPRAAPAPRCVRPGRAGSVQRCG